MPTEATNPDTARPNPIQPAPAPAKQSSNRHGLKPERPRQTGPPPGPEPPANSESGPVAEAKSLMNSEPITCVHGNEHDHEEHGQAEQGTNEPPKIGFTRATKPR